MAGRKSDNLDTDAVSATYDAGVLTVRIPVAEQSKPRRIEVTRPSPGAGSRAVSGSKNPSAINA
ncbi:hypothetical protein GCM10022261_10500 [Brevibacterium daeguense]|uniref:SHSP domain-containing protein n=1 Tax=Brevibacterium daeguense TaxID=909936 RepID=A0ABP8EHU4_9MICO